MAAGAKASEFCIQMSFLLPTFCQYSIILGDNRVEISLTYAVRTPQKENILLTGGSPGDRKEGRT